MYFTCNGQDNKPYTIEIQDKPLKWRCKDSSNVGIQDGNGVYHTCRFGSEYQAALFLHYIDYVYDVEGTLEKSLVGEMGQSFRSDLRNPSAKNTGYGFMMLTLIGRKVLDYEEFKKEVDTKANFRREHRLPEPYVTGIDWSWTFLEYVIKAMVDVNHIKVDNGKIEFT